MKKIQRGILAASLALPLILTACGTQQAPQAKEASAKTETPAPSTPAKDTAVKSSAEQDIVIEPGGKLGPDGKMHDAFINGDIKVQVGQPVTLKFYNYDDGTHTYTSPELGLNVKIDGSKKKGEPAVTTYTFTPSKEGTFNWICADQCDGDNGQWAMSQKGYMQGTITVVKDNIQRVSLVVNPEYKLGPDGKMHDAFTETNFTVNANQPVELTVYNFDDGTHTITNKDLGLDMKIKGSEKKGEAAVSTTTFTPTKIGTFTWNCMDKCDGGNGQWAMTQKEYMMGDITVK